MGMLSINNKSIKGYFPSEVNIEIDKAYIKANEYSNPSLTLFGSMLYDFAYKLPYSMDIEQEEYVPGDFLNLEPYDVDENRWFKFSDRRTLFNAMEHTDARRSGILLQVCFIFQQMLLGKVTPYELSDSDYERTRISKRDEEYNRNFFTVMKKLPEYYLKVISANTNEERRKILDEVYDEMRYYIGMRVGSFRKSEIHDGVEVITRDRKATIPYAPYLDIEMILDHSGFYNMYFRDLTNKIKEEQLKNYQKPVVPNKLGR